MTQRTLSIEIEGAGRYRTVTVRTPVTMGELSYEVQVDTIQASQRLDVTTERQVVEDAVLAALAEVVRHPGFAL